MRFELLIFGLTAFFIANTYYDGNYMKFIQCSQKYLKMVGFAFAGLSIYLFLKKNPSESQTIIQQAANIIKSMPSSKSDLDIFTPFTDFTNQTPFVQGFQNQQQVNRIIESGKKGTKRCVSETKKKFVAAQQGWKCGSCEKQLPAWFEVDHKIRLEHGGSNHVDNLVAMCRDCHGRKTAIENL